MYMYVHNNSAFRIGGRAFTMRVRLKGLTTRPALNDCRGRAIFFDASKARWAVTLDGGQKVSVKGQNLEFLTDDDASHSSWTMGGEFMAADRDPWKDPTVPCGAAALGGESRSACRFPCCKKQPSAESDEEWEMRQPEAAADGARSSIVGTSKRQRRCRESTAHDAVYRALCMRFPEHGPNAEVARALRRLEKFELACQGDDHADKEHRATNSEALLYARAAAVAAGAEWSIRELAQSRGEASAVRRLQELPFIGSFRAAQMVELAVRGTCQALAAFEAGRPPIGSDGRARVLSEGGRSMCNAPAKLALCKGKESKPCPRPPSLPRLGGEQAMPSPPLPPSARGCTPRVLAPPLAPSTSTAPSPPLLRLLRHSAPFLPYTFRVMLPSNRAPTVIGTWACVGSAWDQRDDRDRALRGYVPRRALPTGAIGRRAALPSGGGGDSVDAVGGEAGVAGSWID